MNCFEGEAPVVAKYAASSGLSVSTWSFLDTKMQLTSKHPRVITTCRQSQQYFCVRKLRQHWRQTNLSQHESTVSLFCDDRSLCHIILVSQAVTNKDWVTQSWIIPRSSTTLILHTRTLPSFSASSEKSSMMFSLLARYMWRRCLYHEYCVRISDCIW